MVQKAAQKPERLNLVNLDTGEGYTCQFNPTQFEEQINVSWNRQSIPGLSHQPLQYGYTENFQFSLDLFARADSPGEVNQSAIANKEVVGLAGILDFRNYLMSLCYPRVSTTVGGAGPPRVLVTWPNVLQLTTIIVSYRCTHSRFNIEGTTVEYAATVGFEEHRDTRVTSDDVRRLGAQRHTTPGR